MRLRCRIDWTWFFYPCPLAHQMRPARHLAPARLRVLVGDPHRGQIVGGQQLREDLRIELVGLDLRLGDRARLLRVRDHHARDPALQQPDDRVRGCPVASSATSSLGARLSAKIRSASGVVAIWPAWRTRPSSQIATCANSRCTSSPIHRRVTALTSTTVGHR
jgi:hypothetical protein